MRRGQPALRQALTLSFRQPNLPQPERQRWLGHRNLRADLPVWKTVSSQLNRTFSLNWLGHYGRFHQRIAGLLRLRRWLVTGAAV